MVGFTSQLNVLTSVSAFRQEGGGGGGSGGCYPGEAKIHPGLSGLTTPAGFSLIVASHELIRKGPAAAGPERNNRLRGGGSDRMSLLQCEDCDKQYPTQRGLSLHRQSAHPEEYHLANVPKERKKARWECEEMVLLARKEVEMARAAGGKVNVKQLASLIPDRTYKSIRGVRKKAAYQAIVQSLSTSDGTQDGAPSMPSEGTIMGSEAQSLSSEEWTHDWAADLIKVVKDSEIVLGELWLEDIVPGQPAVDANYEAWLPPRKRRSRGAQEPCKVPEGGRAKRRAQYARVQRCYDRDRTRCAQEVITGAWRNPPASLPMDTQEAFWRNLFETPSVPDSRSFPPVGDVHWELLIRYQRRMYQGP